MAGLFFNPMKASDSKNGGKTHTVGVQPSEDKVPTEKIMKKTALAMATAAILTSSFALAGGHAKSVKLGVVLGFTGPAESLA